MISRMILQSMHETALRTWLHFTHELYIDCIWFGQLLLTMSWYRKIYQSSTRRHQYHETESTRKTRMVFEATQYGDFLACDQICVVLTNVIALAFAPSWSLWERNFVVDPKSEDGTLVLSSCGDVEVNSAVRRPQHQVFIGTIRITSNSTHSQSTLDTSPPV